MQGTNSPSHPVADTACPLCAERRHTRIEHVRLADLAHEYRRQYGVDVLAEFPSGLESLELRRCGGCGLEFYVPGPAGSAAFYTALGRSQVYYSSARWEFGETIRRLPADPDLVDVGCGDGVFLALVGGTRKRGLELNPDAVRRAQARGLEVREGLLPVLPSGSADYLTMFQVLEHVERPVEVLQETARVLRPGGRLFVAVPNNDAFIGRALHDPLNAPPHHPLRWRADALRHVPQVAPFELEELLEEPLEPGHLYNYRRTQFVDFLSRLAGRRLPRMRVSWGMVMVRRLANLWTQASLRLAPRGPTKPGTGFSVLAIYRRRPDRADSCGEEAVR